MTKIFQERMTAGMEGEFVVFLIGMRINKPLKVHKWLPVTLAMPKMLKELYSNPKIGFIHQESWFGRTSIMLQYWKSFEHLEKYAKNKDSSHFPEWSKFNKNIGSNGDVGIWHETYLSKPGQYECVYNNMPRFGLGRVGQHIPATGKYSSAHNRVYKNNT